MKKINKPSAAVKGSRQFILLLAAIVFFAACNKHNEPRALKDFMQVNLTANTSGYGAAHVDPLLLNAWGLAFSSNGTPWVNATGGHVSAVYDKEGATVRAAVNVPSPAAATGGLPTGIVFSGSATDFMLPNNAAARFIFVGVDGVLSAWNGAAGNNAFLIKNNSATSAYTGLALATNAGNSYLYAANFRAGKIDVWDKTFAAVPMSFKDNQLPSGYSPFNIQAVGNWLYVTYAKVGPDGRDVKGRGNGFVDIYNTDGSLVKRFAKKGLLNSPWGVALAPSSFFMDTDNDDHSKDNSGTGSNGSGNSGHGSGSGIKGPDDQSIVLVGNFGDGRINAYRENGDFIGQLRSHGHDIVIDGLWALSFPPATATTIDPNRLYFTAGPKLEADGLFGYLVKQ